MRGGLILALAFSAASVTATSEQPQATEVTMINDGSCIAMTPEEKPSGYQLKNACSVCRTALVTWCDGVGREFKVPGRSSVHLPYCPGVQTLVSDVACTHIP